MSHSLGGQTMKQSMMFIPTLREVPSDAEIRSHQFYSRWIY